VRTYAVLILKIPVFYFSKVLFDIQTLRSHIQICEICIQSPSEILTLNRGLLKRSKAVRVLRPKGLKQGLLQKPKSLLLSLIGIFNKSVYLFRSKLTGVTEEGVDYKGTTVTLRLVDTGSLPSFLPSLTVRGRPYITST